VHFYYKMRQFGKPIYGDYFLETLYAPAQGSPNIFVREPLHNIFVRHFVCICIVRGLDILRNRIVSGYVTFYEINNFFQMHYFSLLTKCLREPDEMSWRAGFGPRTVVWRPWSTLTPVILYIIIIKRCYACSNENYLLLYPHNNQ